MTRVRLVASVSFLMVVGLALVACRGDQQDPTEPVRVAAVAAAQTEAQPSEAQPYVLPAIVPGTAPPNPYPAALVERGHYLVEFGGCNDCHTPVAFDPDIGMPMPDMSRRLSGHPNGAPGPTGSIGPGDMALIGPTFTSFVLPFGTVYSMNLTPDIDTGTGTWTETMFVDIFRTGRHLGGNGRPVLPPMPFLNVNHLSDEDLVSVFAYLRSLPPIRNMVPSPDVPEPVMWSVRDSYDRILGRRPAEGEVVLAAR